MTRRLLPSALLALTAAALPAATAHAQDAPAPECGVSAISVAPDGARGFLSVQDGRLVTSATPGDRLTFRPQALAGIGGAGGGGTSFSNDLAVRDGGGVISIYRKTETQPDGTTALTALSERRVAGGWEGTRAIATGGRHIYRLDGRQLLRNRYSPEGSGGSASLHFTVGDTQTVAARGHKPYRTLTTTSGPRSRTTLLATTTAGALRKVVVDERRGRVVSDRRIATGFRGVQAIRAGYCQTGSAKPLLAQTRAGELRLFRLDGDTVTGGDVVATGITSGLF